ncbi:MAG TPA: zinc carboxypeptidase [Bacteroidales bacterium]|nr:zinc carboxypeptidase [Bacteroidales bacterium]HBZ22502.1 zinc carboxypeptidase [Bacteroidales bacterium]
MKQNLLIFFGCFMIAANVKSQTIKSPGEFLGYELGTQFTFHYRAVDYFRYIAESSTQAEYREYGTTYEGRQLGVCIVSSEENLSRLDEYRKNNLIKTGLSEGSFTGKQIPIIWLGYNIHGNESAGMETAMKTLYTLVSGSYPGAEEWLKTCIIIIDPCQNPDGRDMYTNRFRNSQNLIPNPDGKSAEHNQGWPVPRTNHYMFDLNRDWTWQTQTETSQRIELYNQFMPQVHADFHEMGAESTFFFPPGATPWHEVITPWQHDFHTLMGKGNAALFDEKSKLYFTKENFDLFCPSFGDTWPLFNGAIGFTYEQGGSGVSGLAYKQKSDDTLTLKKRIDGHFLASMATLKVSYENRDKLITEFNKFFSDNVNKPAFQFKSIIIKGSNRKPDLEDLFHLLAKNQIRYSYAGNTGKKYKGFDYLANGEGEVTIEKGDILVSAFQPQSRFVQVLFEPDSKASDSLSYDLTAWALPYAYNLKAYALIDQIKPLDGKVETAEIVNNSIDSPYGYAVQYDGFNVLKFISELQLKKIRSRYSMKPFTIGEKNYERGSFIITRGDNLNMENKLDKIISDLAGRLKVSITPLTTGLSEKGKDAGSDYSPLMKRPSVAVISGKASTSTEVGELWYFFERELNYPVSLINSTDVKNTDLSDYDVLLVTSGNYPDLKDTIVDYAKRGGRVVLLEKAISIFASEKSTSLFKSVETRTAEQKAAEKKEKSDDLSLLKKFGDEKRHLLSESSAGSIYKVTVDTTNPFGFGLGREWFIMKETQPYPFLAKGNNIGYILENKPVSGFAGYKYQKLIKNTMVIGSESVGKGEVIYITDDPYFRAFWKSGRDLLWNVVFR